MYYVFPLKPVLVDFPNISINTSQSRPIENIIKNVKFLDRSYSINSADYTIKDNCL